MKQFKVKDCSPEYQQFGYVSGVVILNVNGFGQKNLNDPNSWEDPLKDIDTSKYNSMQEIPVPTTGCDSAYSWAKKFQNLAYHDTTNLICDKLENFLRNDHNSNGNFLHKASGMDTHLAFTGGEPMLNQTGITEIMYEFANRRNIPLNVTVETNGTQLPRENFVKMLSEYNDVYVYTNYTPTKWFWSVSPKLRASGEKWEDAICPNVVKEYKKLSNFGQLKYVVDGSEETWDEVNRATELYRNEGIEWPVYIMPVSATKEDQEKVQMKIAEDAIRRGFRVAARVHCWIWNNSIGK